jgi:hypothetical protein
MQGLHRIAGWCRRGKRHPAEGAREIMLRSQPPSNSHERPEEAVPRTAAPIDFVRTCAPKRLLRVVHAMEVLDHDLGPTEMEHRCGLGRQPPSVSPAGLRRHRPSPSHHGDTRPGRRPWNASGQRALEAAAGPGQVTTAQPGPGAAASAWEPSVPGPSRRRLGWQPGRAAAGSGTVTAHSDRPSPASAVLPPSGLWDPLAVSPRLQARLTQWDPSPSLPGICLQVGEFSISVLGPRGQVTEQ